MSESDQEKSVESTVFKPVQVLSAFSQQLLHPSQNIASMHTSAVLELKSLQIIEMTGKQGPDNQGCTVHIKFHITLRKSRKATNGQSTW